MYRNDCRLLFWNQYCDLPIRFRTPRSRMKIIVKLLANCSKNIVTVTVTKVFILSVGRLFHTRGASTANALSPNLLRVRGTYRSLLSAVHNEARDGRSATGLIRYAMYWGACPTSALWTSRVWSRSFQRLEASVTPAMLEWHDRTVAGWGPFVLLHVGHAATD